jgi:hypothetical protein
MKIRIMARIMRAQHHRTKTRVRKLGNPAAGAGRRSLKEIETK